MLRPRRPNLAIFSSNSVLSSDEVSISAATGRISCTQKSWTAWRHIFCSSLSSNSPGAPSRLRGGRGLGKAVGPSALRTRLSRGKRNPHAHESPCPSFTLPSSEPTVLTLTLPRRPVHSPPHLTARQHGLTCCAS